MVKKKQVKVNKKKQNVWFKKIRGSYLPASTTGWLTYVPFIAYLCFAYTIGVKDTGSAALAILFIIPNWVAAVAVMTFIAARKS